MAKKVAKTVKKSVKQSTPKAKPGRTAKARAPSKPEAVLEMVRLTRKVLEAEGELKQLIIDLGFTGKNVDLQLARCIRAVRHSDAVKAKNKLANQPAKKAPKKKSAKSAKKMSASHENNG